MLLEEFSFERDAVINPDMVTTPVADFPAVTISCFSKKLFDSALSQFEPKLLVELRSAVGRNPVYEVCYQGQRFALFQSYVGEPSCVGQYEDLIAIGSRQLILLGNCGVLDRSIEDCGIIIPTLALRDEGTSYHYAPPSDRIAVNRKYREQFQQVLRQFGYREKVARRRAQGAICVEMECAGMQALCDFRNTGFFQFFYAGDNLDHSTWQPRSLSGDVRLDDKTKIMFLAFELGLKIMQAGE